MRRGRSGKGRVGLSRLQRALLEHVDRSGFVSVKEAFRIRSGTGKFEWSGPSDAPGFSSVYRSMRALERRGLVARCADPPHVWLAKKYDHGDYDREVLPFLGLPPGLHVEHRNGRDVVVPGRLTPGGRWAHRDIRIRLGHEERGREVKLREVKGYGDVYYPARKDLLRS